MVQDQIEREVEIAAPVERVWALVTEARHLGTWFGDAGAEVDLRPGGVVELRWREHGTARGRVVVVEPPHRVCYRWAPFKDPGEGELAEGNSTHVEFTLRADGDRTLLRVVESGFATLDCTPEERAGHIAGNEEGWRIELGELVEYALRPAAQGVRGGSAGATEAVQPR